MAVSPYSFYAFSYLQKNRPALKNLGVEVEYVFTIITTILETNTFTLTDSFPFSWVVSTWEVVSPSHHPSLHFPKFKLEVN